jgi:hypothetical protein
VRTLLEQVQSHRPCFDRLFDELSYWQWLLLALVGWMLRFLSRAQKANFRIRLTRNIHKREAQQDRFLKTISSHENDVRFRNGRTVWFKSRRAPSAETARLDPMWARLVSFLVVLLVRLVEILSRHRVPWEWEGDKREDDRGS